jgi:hypothetical protein
MPTVPRKWLILLANLVGVLVAGQAGAAELVCGMVDKDVIAVDGLLDDWQGVQAVRFGAAGKDANLALRCNYDKDTIYLAILVTDEQIIRRGKKDRGPEDVVVVDFGKDRLEITPGGEGGEPMKARWASGASTKTVAIVDSLQDRGFSLEIGLPRGRVPGAAKNATSVPATIEFRDADMFTEKTWQETVTTGPGALTLEEGAQLYKQVLEDLRIKPKDIWLDKMVDMDGEPGDERVIVAGRTVAIIADSYAYMQLPVPRKDILKLQLVDLAGAGKHAIVVHYVERGNGGSREVLGVWTVLGDGAFARPFAAEVAKESPAGRMSCTWALEPKLETKGTGKKAKKVKGKGQDIVIRVGEVRGFSAETWNELPAEDMTPILLPWGELKEQRWHFRGDEAYGE